MTMMRLTAQGGLPVAQQSAIWRHQGPSGGMVDAADSKSAAARRAGSSPASGTSPDYHHKHNTARASARRVALAALLALAACGDAEESTNYPELLPTKTALAAPRLPSHAQIAASNPDQVVADLRASGADLALGAAQLASRPMRDGALGERAARLRARAANLAAGTAVKNDTLAARAAALRARAAAL